MGRISVMGNISHQERFAYAIRQLRTYNKIIRYGLPEESFNIPEIEAGFNSPFNSTEEIRAKKMLVAASTEAIMSNNAIPHSRKERQARKNAEEIKLAFDAAKLDFAEISVPEREERIKKNAIANRAARLKRVGRALKRKGTKLAIGGVLTAIGSAVGVTIAIPAGVIYGIYTLIPDKWKKHVKDKAVDIIDKASNKAESLVNRFKNTSVGREITDTVERIKESKVMKTVREVTETIGKKTVQAYNYVKNAVTSGAKKVIDFVKSFF